MAERSLEPVDGEHEGPLHAGRAAFGQIGKNGIVVFAECVDERQGFNINRHCAFSSLGPGLSVVESGTAGSSR